MSSVSATAYLTRLEPGVPAVVDIDDDGTTLCVVDPDQAQHPDTAQSIADEVDFLGGNCRTCTALCPIRAMIGA